jgi:tetratricopeptide (TPR) repeat protein
MSTALMEPRSARPLILMEGPAEEILAQADRISKSDGFRKSERLRRFLQFTVDRTLKGDVWQLRENVIAREVFDRPVNFDPRVESIVRVEAKRLRRKLEEYYTLHGADDPIMIEFRTGSYVPEIRENQRRTLHSPRAADLTYGAPDGAAYAGYLEAVRDLSLPQTRTATVATAKLAALTTSHPDYALAHSALADAYLNEAMLGVTAPQMAYDQARQAAERGWHLNPALPHSLTSLAQVRVFFEGNSESALELTNRAVELMPHHAPAHVVRGLALVAQHRLPEGIAALQRAVELAPLCVRAHQMLALALGASNRPVEAEAWFQAAEALQPGGFSRILCGLQALARKNHTVACHHVREYRDSSAVSFGVQGACAAALGDRKASARFLAKLDEVEGYADPLASALIYREWGETARAAEAFRASATARSPLATLCAVMGLA